MAYSFIELPTKTPWTHHVKRVGVVTLLLLVLMLLAVYTLRLLGDGLSRECRQLVKEQDVLALQIGQMEFQRGEAERRRQLFEQIQTVNQLQREKVKNILDLVPDNTTLQRFELQEGALIVEGESRNDEVGLNRFVAALSELYHLQKRQTRREGKGLVHFRLQFGPQEARP